MSGSPAEAASAAVERLRSLREHANQRRQRAKEAVKQVREHNRLESLQVMERARSQRRLGQSWPADRPDPQMSLYETDDTDTVRPAPPSVSRRPVRAEDDDWSQETWLH